MSRFTERTQVLLTPEQRARLERIARRNNTSVGAVVREAIEIYTGRRAQPREEALEQLIGLEVPVDDWETMKDEIARGALG